MKLRKYILAVGAAAAICASSVHAQERFYDQNGYYQGRADYGGNGDYRFYDRNGYYQGRAEPQGGGGYRFYDQNGYYRGRTGY